MGNFWDLTKADGDDNRRHLAAARENRKPTSDFLPEDEDESTEEVTDEEEK